MTQIEKYYNIQNSFYFTEGNSIIERRIGFAFHDVKHLLLGHGQNQQDIENNFMDIDHKRLQYYMKFLIFVLDLYPKEGSGENFGYEFIYTDGENRKIKAIQIYILKK